MATAEAIHTDETVRQLRTAKLGHKSLLHVAATDNLDDLVKAYLTGEDFLITDDKGNNILHVAAQRNCPSVEVANLQHDKRTMARGIAAFTV
ncbi:unnamed protein product, partial [Nippostrongylus brasiliensis]|uniref:ANK_REP_REGION domain-containing protein n=1 Tax=Nippostrongylus brasiliensis TaxID=27835 RepID=A0A0N4Y6L7_NIPBR